ncbi:MAG: HesA/MoeB/ThiF family protein, partial [Candidatus Hydrogenedentes bacterium]|nr:HesA/MoeB/ThiF family protein [Candidatus Hydrogenedentota bacterium]
YHYADVGESKAALAEKRLREQNPFIDIQLHTEGLTPENVVETLAPYDLVLDCTDNFATKFLLNDAAVLTGKPIIFASIYQYDGQLLFVRPGSGGPCLRCLWPEVPEAGCVGSCAEVGVLGAVPGIFGAMQAVEAMKYILGMPDQLGNEMVIFNCLTYSSQRVKMPRHPACPVCGSAPRILSIVRDEYLPPEDITVDVSGMDEDRLRAYRIIDIREAEEVAAQPLEGVDHDRIAMSAWDTENPPIRGDEPCLLCCSRGMRSLTLAEKLRKLGYRRVYSVQNGWEAFHQLARR